MSKKHSIQAFTNHFDEILTKVASGDPVHKALKDLNVHESWIAWVLADPQRKEAYEQAQAIATEVYASEIIDISNQADTEDMYLAKLRIDARKYMMERWNRKRYGEVKQLEVTNVVDIADAMEQAEKRLEKGIVIENGE